MISTTTFRHAALAALLGLGVVAASAPVQATGSFDGKWSVVIVTEKGDCDRAYRYPIDIKNATLVNAGSTSFDISGRVQGDGAVAVKISYGQKGASGSGRLSGNSGEGRWAGGGCAGSWMAERRGWAPRNKLRRVWRRPGLFPGLLVLGGSFLGAAPAPLPPLRGGGATR